MLAGMRWYMGEKEKKMGNACAVAPSPFSCPTCSLPSLLLYAASLLIIVFAGEPLRYAGLLVALVSFMYPWIVARARRRKH